MIRSRTNAHSTHSVTFYAAVIAALTITGIYLLSAPNRGSTDSAATLSSPEVSPVTALNQGLSSMSMSKNKEELDEEDVDPMKITLGSVAYGGKNLPYYHCGPLPSADNPDLTELVLLHGAAFTKEDWKSSGILDMLCEINNEEDEGNLSISALDLPVSADGNELGLAFDALTGNKILSGRAATFVSPSASGKALVSLGEMATGGSHELSRMIKAWIPVASGSVLGADESTLLQYKSANIPVFAIHGNQDAGGVKVTKRLTDLIDAKGVELEGRHPVYLDSPEEFVQEVMQFLDEMGL
eukprot:CAMPEP_0183739240 /NCGR_PEP_ID=MMETSP0737-20130205/56557_1 /TAXON_ID=385413 /ORGANISM="Thalassiosira miniscula, Strain CCMP1093" /LENGTH=297 /DNA_ID=CAMNT_0025973989 /DNA_START=63 /DNA_END=956 /DNA_ORIENTATION=+